MVTQPGTGFKQYTSVTAFGSAVTCTSAGCMAGGGLLFQRMLTCFYEQFAVGMLQQFYRLLAVFQAVSMVSGSVVVGCYWDWVCSGLWLGGAMTPFWFGREGSWLVCQILPAIGAVSILDLAANSGSSRMSQAPNLQ